MPLPTLAAARVYNFAARQTDGEFQVKVNALFTVLFNISALLTRSLCKQIRSATCVLYFSKDTSLIFAVSELAFRGGNHTRPHLHFM